MFQPGLIVDLLPAVGPVPVGDDAPTAVALLPERHDVAEASLIVTVVAVV